MLIIYFCKSTKLNITKRNFHLPNSLQKQKIQIYNTVFTENQYSISFKRILIYTRYDK